MNQRRIKEKIIETYQNYNKNFTILYQNHNIIINKYHNNNLFKIIVKINIKEMTTNN